MPYIKIIPPVEAEGKLKDIYARVTGPGGKVDNILQAHSLRPHTLEGHMALYKATLHHYGNKLPKTYLETIGVFVSLINGCDYCVTHHFTGLKRLMKDDKKADSILEELKSAATAGAIDFASIDARDAAGLAYAGKLTRRPQDIEACDIDRLRKAGFSDGEILEINQITAYFAYANRTVTGLGVSANGDELGLSPSNCDDINDWGHK